MDFEIPVEALIKMLYFAPLNILIVAFRSE